MLPGLHLFLICFFRSRMCVTVVSSTFFVLALCCVVLELVLSLSSSCFCAALSCLPWVCLRCVRVVHVSCAIIVTVSVRSAFLGFRNFKVFT